MNSIPTQRAAARSDSENRLAGGDGPRRVSRAPVPAADPSDIRDLIEYAIGRRRVLGLTYHYYSRCVEPCCLAVDRDGNDTLIAWQVSGGSDDGSCIGWKQFRISELAGVRMLIDTFSD